MYRNCDMNGAPFIEEDGVFATPSISFIPQDLNPILTSSSKVIGDTNAILTIEFDPIFLQDSGYFNFTFPAWYSIDGLESFIQILELSSSDDCFDPVNFKIESCTFSSNQVIIRFKEYSSGTISFKLKVFRNPVNPGVKDGFQLLTTDRWGYTIRINYDAIELSTKVDQILQISTLQHFAVNTVVGTLGDLAISFQMPVPTEMFCYIRIIFPPDFIIDPNTITQYDVDGFFLNENLDTQLPLTDVTWVGNTMMINSCTNSIFLWGVTDWDGPTGSITIKNINFPYSVKETSNFIVQVFYDEDFTQQISEGQFSIPASKLLPGNIILTEFTGITEDDKLEEASGTYSIKFTPETNLFKKAKVIIRTPTLLSLGTSCTVSPIGVTNVGTSPTCTVLADGWEIGGLWEDTSNGTPVYQGGNPISLQITGGTNPSGEVNVGSWSVETKSFDLATNAYYDVDFGNSATSFTTIIPPAIIPISIQSTSLVTIASSTYTFEFDINNDIPVGGFLDLTYPNDVELLGIETCKIQNSEIDPPIDLSCVEINNGVRMSISQEIKRSQNSVYLTIGKFRNPVTLDKTQIFKIESFDQEENPLEEGEGFQLQMTSLAQIDSFKVLRESSVNSETNKYQIQFTISGFEIQNGYKVGIKLPSQLSTSAIEKVEIVQEDPIAPFPNVPLLFEQIDDQTLIVVLDVLLNFQGEFNLLLSFIRNYRSTKPTESFQLWLQTAQSQTFSEFKGEVILTNTIPSTIKDGTLSQSTLTYSEDGTYEIKFTPTYLPLEPQNVVLVSYPPQVIVPSDQDCSTLANGAYTCSVDSSTNTIKFSNFDSAQFSTHAILKFFATNPENNLGPRDPFTIKTFEDSQMQYQIDVLTSEESTLIPETVCNSPCKTCDLNISPDYCTSCWEDAQLQVNYLQETSETTQTCQPKCSNGFSSNGSNPKVCTKCESQCGTCIDEGTEGDISQCVTCALGYKDVSDNICVACYENQVQIGMIDGVPQCEDCFQTCLTCSGTSDNCDTCKDEFVKQGNQCLEKCSENYYLNETKKECFPCESPCASCFGSATHCLSCDNTDGRSFLHENQCLKDCPEDYKADANKICQLIPKFSLISDKSFYLRCEEISLSLTNFANFDLQNSQFKWSYNIQCPYTYYAYYQSTFNKKLQRLFNEAQNKTLLTIGSDLTQMLKAEVVIEVTVEGTNQDGEKVTRNLNIKIYGNKNHYSIVEPQTTYFYAFRGYKFNPRFRLNKCPYCSDKTFYLHLKQKMQCSLRNIETNEVVQIENCYVTVDDGIEIDTEYELLYQIQPHQYHSLIQGSFKIITYNYAPDCHIMKNDQLNLDHILLEGQELIEERDVMKLDELIDHSQIIMNSIDTLDPQQMSYHDKGQVVSTMKMISENKQNLKQGRNMIKIGETLNNLLIKDDQNQIQFSSEKIDDKIYYKAIDAQMLFDIWNINKNIGESKNNAITLAIKKFSPNLALDSAPFILQSKSRTIILQRLSKGQLEKNGFILNNISGIKQLHIPFDKQLFKENQYFFEINYSSPRTAGVSMGRQQSLTFASQVLTIDIKEYYSISLDQEYDFALRNFDYGTLRYPIKLQFKMEKKLNSNSSYSCHRFDQNSNEWVSIKSKLNQENIVSCETKDGSQFAVIETIGTIIPIVGLGTFLKQVFIVFDLLLLGFLILGYYSQKNRYFILQEKDMLTQNREENSIESSFFISLTLFSRMISSIFIPKRQEFIRLLKILTNLSQLYLLIPLTLLVSMMISSISVGIILIFALARVIQFGVIKKQNSKREKMMYRLATMAFIIVIITHLGQIGGVYTSILQSYSIENEWQYLFLVSLVLEYLIWDMILQPIILVILIKCGAFRKIKFFGSLFEGQKQQKPSTKVEPVYENVISETLIQMVSK